MSNIKNKVSNADRQSANLIGIDPTEYKQYVLDKNKILELNSNSISNNRSHIDEQPVLSIGNVSVRPVEYARYLQNNERIRKLNRTKQAGLSTMDSDYNRYVEVTSPSIRTKVGSVSASTTGDGRYIVTGEGLSGGSLRFRDNPRQHTKEYYAGLNGNSYNASLRRRINDIGSSTTINGAYTMVNGPTLTASGTKSSNGNTRANLQAKWVF